MAKSASQQRREKMQRKREREAAIKAKQSKQNRITTLVVWIVSICIGLSLITGLVVWQVKDPTSLFNNIKRSFTMKKTMVTSEDYELTIADMQYLFYENYNRFMDKNAEKVNIKEDVPLSQQYYDSSSGYTWFDYFCNATKEDVEHYILLATAARDEGYKLSKDDQKEIDGLIDAFEEYGAKEGYTLSEYIEYAYGEFVGEKNIRRCKELITLANKYYNDKIDAASLAYKQEDYLSFLENNFDEYAGTTCFVEFMYFSFEPAYEDDYTEEEKAEAKKKAEELAEELAQNTGVDKFKEVLVKYIKTTGMSEDMDPEEYIDLRYTETAPYEVESSFGKWAFADEREAGHTMSIEKDDGYIVYCLTKKNYFDERATKNIRHILIEPSQYSSKEEAKAKAESLLEEWKNGEATEESFGKLARLNSSDQNSFENGGRYMYLREGEIGQAKFDDWCFSVVRKPGDTGIVETEYGYHVIYFIGDGVPTWQATLLGGMQEMEYEQLCTFLATKYKVSMKTDYFKHIVN